MEIPIITFAITSILAIAAILADGYSSKDFRFFGLTEANALAQDKHGFFNNKTVFISLISTGIAIAAGVVGIIIGSRETVYFVAAMLLVVAGLRGYAFFDNQAAKKRGRARQVEFLTRLKSLIESGATEDDLFVQFNNMPAMTRGGLTFYPLFGWIVSDEEDITAANHYLRRKVIELARQDQAKWFDKF